MTARDATVCMMRIRNEGRWIGRSLARTFHVCRAVVVWDDASTDDTETQVRAAVCEAIAGTPQVVDTPWGWRTAGRQRIPAGELELHFLKSPFRPARRRIDEVNEVRDKNVLWDYVKTQVEFRHVLCLDGDEILSRALLRAWSAALALLDDGVDVLLVPMVYLWDGEGQRRIDGWYEDADDGLPRARFPRLFTVAHLDDEERFQLHLAHVATRGGLHCGSVPGAGVTRPWRLAVAGGAVVQLGYADRRDRERKYVWYNRIDPNNEREGRYAHIVGVPDHHAPGPVRLVPWDDR
jgi:hypothetical protein